MTLYLVAIVPPEPVLGQVWALKQEVHARTGSRNAVGLPPHLTLVPPTRQPAGFEVDCLRALQAFAATQRPFTVGLAGFGWFGTRTLFVRVTPAAALRSCQAALMAWCAARLPALPPATHPFTPHMTLATRDLPADQVAALQPEFAARAYAATFEVSGITLFRHDGRQWLRVADLPLGLPGA